MRPLAEAIGWAVLAAGVVSAATAAFAIARMAAYCMGGCG